MLHSGIQGVQVLCDLAMISAGEDAIELGRVSCFLSAVMGFAPLIFWKTQNTEEDEKIKNQEQQQSAVSDIVEEPENDIFRLFDGIYIEEAMRDQDCDSPGDDNVSCDEAGLTHLLARCKKVWDKAGDGDTLLLHWV